MTNIVHCLSTYDTLQEIGLASGRPSTPTCTACTAADCSEGGCLAIFVACASMSTCLPTPFLNKIRATTKTDMQAMVDKDPKKYPQELMDFISVDNFNPGTSTARASGTSAPSDCPCGPATLTIRRRSQSV